jgi:hypothetical protein
MALSYGKHPKSYQDEDVQAVLRCLTRLGNTLRTGVWRVDVYPWLKYVNPVGRGDYVKLMTSDTYPVI